MTYYIVSNKDKTLFIGSGHNINITDEEKKAELYNTIEDAKGEVENCLKYPKIYSEFSKVFINYSIYEVEFNLKEIK